MSLYGPLSARTGAHRHTNQVLHTTANNDGLRGRDSIGGGRGFRLFATRGFQRVISFDGAFGVFSHVFDDLDDFRLGLRDQLHHRFTIRVILRVGDGGQGIEEDYRLKMQTMMKTSMTE